MLEADALDRIVSLVSATSDPALSVDELIQLLLDARRPDVAGNLPTNVATAPTWQAGTYYSVFDVVTASPAADRWWICTTPGTSDATQPDWPDLAGLPPDSRRTIVDGDDVRWTDAGTLWRPTYAIYAAAVQGWEMKAAKVADQFDFGTDGQTFRRGQLIAHANRMQRQYRRRIAQVG